MKFSGIRGPSSKEVDAVAAQKYIDLVVAGKSPLEAAKEAGIHPAAGAVVRALADLRHYVVPDATDRKTLLNAAMMQLMLDPSTDAAGKTAAARVIKDDPDLGYNLPPAVQINFSSEVLDMKLPRQIISTKDFETVEDEEASDK